MKAIKNIAIVISLAFIIWVAISFIEVNMFNMNVGQARYISEFNFFKILISLQ